jgi:hypothetical protein
VPDITLSISDDQVTVLRKLDATKTAKAVLVEHVAAWLLPYVQQLVRDERESVITAYKSATPQVQATVRTALGLG